MYAVQSQSKMSYKGLIVCAVIAAATSLASGQSAGLCENAETQCCAPGSPQLGEDPFMEFGFGSFCTNKPFQDSYTINKGAVVPVQLNFKDYCSDEIIFSSYFTVTVDEFSVVSVPCTHAVPDCSTLEVSKQTACAQGKNIWSDPSGSYRCSNPSFYEKELSKRVCNSANYGRTIVGRYSTPKSSEYTYNPPTQSFAQDPMNGYCTCNMTTVNNRNNQTGSSFIGPPTKFIKDGMSTFYVEVMIGGRKTSDPSPDCFCNETLGNLDTSEECMCYLGTRKVPYIYNNSFIPYYTALISMQQGKLIFENTFVRYNFDGNGIGCVGCSQDNCWGVPYKGLESWLQMGRTVKQVQDGKTCAIANKFDPANPTDPYCDYPQSDTQIAQCALKVYVAWVGTDGFGRPSQSNNKMFSKFSQMGVSSMAWQFYTGAANLATDVTQRITRRLFGGGSSA